MKDRQYNFNPEEKTTGPQNPYLEHEEDIVWLKDPSQFRYVRETIWSFSTRKGPPPKNILEGGVVAYAVLRGDAPSEDPRRFERRVWAYYPRDYAGLYKKGAPVEGVDPKSIKPGQPSRSPEG